METEEKTKEQLISENQSLPKELADLKASESGSKRVEAALRESEERFRTCIENMLDSFGIYLAVRDESGRITDFLIEYMNAAACENNRMSREEQVGQRLSELLPAHRKPGLFDDYCRVVETGKQLIKESFPYEDVYAGQSIARFFDIHVTKLGDGFAASWRDVTERKRAEEVLRESEERFRAIFTQARDGIVLIDGKTGSIVDCNPEFGRQTGRELEELKRMRIWEIRPTEKVEAAREKFQEVAVVGGGGSSELEFQQPGGEIVPIEFLSKKVVIGGKEYLQSISRDITERKKAEEALKDSEKKFADLFRTAPMLMAVNVIQDGRFMEVNDCFSSTLGYSKEEVIGRTSADIGLYADPNAREGLIEQFRQNGKLRGCEVNIRDNNKMVHPMLVSTEVITIAGEQCVLTQAIDISERKQQEERTSALLKLSTSTETLDERTLLQRGLDTVQQLTHSRIGFLHFVREDQNEIELVTWSSDTLAHHCKAAFDSHYPVSSAGIWVNSIQLKQPVIINDYATAPNKKGLPDGHSPLQRFISVPILEDGLVRMVVGVGNAARDYDEHDVETVRLFGYDLYRIVQRKKAEEALTQRLDELMRFEKATIQREFRMRDLKEENKRLKEKIEEMEEAGRRDEG